MPTILRTAPAGTPERACTTCHNGAETASAYSDSCRYARSASIARERIRPTMSKKRVATLILIAGVLLVIDWILGVFVVRRILPNWVYLLANIPFGVVYVWTESQWVGSQYRVLGHAVSESLIGFAQLSAVGAQALVYYGIWEVWSRKRHSALRNPRRA